MHLLCYVQILCLPHWRYRSYPPAPLSLSLTLVPSVSLVLTWLIEAVCVPWCQSSADQTFAAAAAAVSTCSWLHDLWATSSDATMQHLLEMQPPVHVADDSSKPPADTIIHTTHTLDTFSVSVLPLWSSGTVFQNIGARPPSLKDSFGVGWKLTSCSRSITSQNLVLNSVWNWTELNQRCAEMRQWQFGL